MDKSIKISSTVFEDKTKVELAIYQLYKLTCANKNELKNQFLKGFELLKIKLNV